MTTRHTLVHQLADWAERTPDTPAIHAKVDGRWVHRTWKQYRDDSRAFAKGLMAMGHQVGECVAIVGGNRMEWVIAEQGIMAARGAPAPIYTTNTSEQMAYIVSNSRARIAICDTAEQLAKYRGAVADGQMSVEHFVTMDTVDDAGDDVRTVEAVIALGRDQDDDALDARIADVTTDETALLIYTSGTTGTPKGVMLNHGGMVEVADTMVAACPRFRDDIPYRAVSYLPLCHAAEQLVTTLGHLCLGGEIYFCPDIAELKDYLVEVRPTVFLGVPRVWEKFEAALSARLSAATGFKGALAQWARDTELAAVREFIATGKNPAGLARAIANKLVIGKVKDALGLGDLYFPVTGSAPVSVGTLEFFASLGIVISEAYGMSETTGVCTLTPVTAPRFGKVGKALDGVQIRIADDGEVQLKGRTMTPGYLHMEQETRDLYTEDGWLCTGDLGSLDQDDYLQITGRKKELLITAGGKNVAPAEMEAYMQQIPGIAQAMVVGDRQPYLCALVTLDVEAVPELARKLGIEDTALAALASNAAMRAYLQDRVETDCNAKVARYQTIKKFEILPVEFSVDGGELTPTMKLRRTIVTERYTDAIAQFYEA